MILIRRKNRSQRQAKPVALTFHPNWIGQDGSSSITFEDEAGNWYVLKPETQDEIRELLSQAHIVAGNFRS